MDPSANQDVWDLFLTLPSLGAAPSPDTTGLDEEATNLLDMLARHSWKLTGETLGTDYAHEAYELAMLLVHKAPDVAREKDIPTQSAIITWAIASRHHLLGQDCGLDVPSLSRELGQTSQELFAGAQRVREATSGTR
ncbi:hypothetical protein ACQPW1_36310 [Nocardia sp. CA-128927]|uniref:hypothetical protein n=1 Tax=Nocardia sp. CA-128927 TaxID=3239975 RepID=UPI003D953AFD